MSLFPVEVDPAERRLAARRLRFVNLVGWFAAGVASLAVLLSLLG